MLYASVRSKFFIKKQQQLTTSKWIYMQDGTENVFSKFKSFSRKPAISMEIVNYFPFILMVFL